LSIPGGDETWNVEISGVLPMGSREKSMGRRRRRVIKIVKKKLPTVFTCPVCSEDAIKVRLPKGAGVATVQCAACGAKDEFDVPRGTQMIDVYCKFTDKFYATGKAEAAPQVKSGQSS